MRACFSYAWQTLRSHTNKTKEKTKRKELYFQAHSREPSALLIAKFAFRRIYPVSLLIALSCPSHCFIKAVFLWLCFDLHMQGKEIALAFASAAGEREFLRGGVAG